MSEVPYDSGSESRRSGRGQRLAIGVAGLAAVPLAVRLVALSLRDLTPGWNDLAGLASDLGIAALAVAGLGLLPRRWLRAVAGGLWGLAHWAHLEHVAALDAPLSLRHAGFVADPELFFGSVLRPTTLLPGLTVVVLGMLAGLLLPQVRRRAVVPLAAGGLVLTLLFALLPGPHSWRDRHFAASELARLRPGPSTGAGWEGVGAEPADLSGERLVPALAGRPNVLLLVLEGVSGAYLPSLGLTGEGSQPAISMPRLDRLVDDSLAARLVLTHQRQTNRGLWSLLCGRLPDLRSGEAKLTELARTGERLPCLPAAFGHAGYRTVFQQAAPLSFMVKDQAMAAIGFDEVRGEESLPRAYERSFWGVDDRAFLEQSAELARRLAEDRARDGRPWLLTLLTVGTHHPFTVPEGAGGGHGGGDANGATLAGALAVLDDALGGFLADLEAAGVPDDTLLVVTSDESAGLPSGHDWTRELSQNVGLLLLRHPTGPDAPGAELGKWTGVLEQPVAHRDTAATVLDAVGLTADDTALSGRSALRRRPPRPIVFGNTFLDRSYGYFPPDRLLVCDGAGRGCRARPFDPHAPFAPADLETAEPALAETVARTVAASARAPADLPRRWALRLHPETVRELPPRGDAHLLFMGQSIHVPAGTAVDFDLDLEAVGTEGWLHLRTDLRRRDRTPPEALWVSELPVLAPGDRIRVALRLVAQEPIDGLEARGQVNVVFPGDVALRVHRAALTAVPAPEGAEPGIRVREIRADRATEPPPLRVGLEAFRELPDGLERRADGAVVTTLQADDRGRNAPPHDVVGPQLYVPRGSRVRLEATVEALDGASDVRLAFASPRHGIVLGRTEPHRVAPGAPVELELEMPLEATLGEVGAVLFVRPRETTRLTIHRLHLEAELP